MKIVIDTNVLISGVFFGGFPRAILNEVIRKNVIACASEKIIDEYNRVIYEMISRKQGKIDKNILSPIIGTMCIVDTKSHVELCRDKNDDMFLECAKDAGAVYIVSGDKDLLVLDKFENIEIITAKEFCKRYKI